MHGFMRFEECESLNVYSALHTVTLTKSDSFMKNKAHMYYAGQAMPRI